MSAQHSPRVDVAQLKKQVDLPALVSQWVKLERAGDHYVGLCPFHPDHKTPSLVVYSDHFHCFGGDCGAHGDAITFIEMKLGLDFRGAVQWLGDHLGDLPLQNVQRTSRYCTPTIPIPQMILEYWHGMVGSEERVYYHQRLLTDATIDQQWLGWDGNNHVIPVWEGEPGASDVFGIRFRKPEGEPRYFGITGRNQPRLYNKWVLKDAAEVFIFFGEFDALLAYQDGMAAVSPTAGQGTWLTAWNRLFDNAERVYVIPDQGELTAGYRVALQFGDRAKVGTFPSGMGKDYTEFRQRKLSVKDFRALVLEPLETTNVLEVESYWEAQTDD